MSDNSCEYIVKQKSEGTALYKKLSALLACIILGVIASSLSMKAPQENLRIIFLLISLAVTALLIFLSLKLLSIEYEITVDKSELTVTTIYGKIHRKLTVAIPLSAISEIGEYNDAAYEQICKIGGLQKDYVAMSSLSAPTVYYAIFDDEKHNCILYFDVTEKAETVFKKLLPGALRASARRINNAQAQQ